MNRFLKISLMFFVLFSLYQCEKDAEGCPNCPCIESIVPTTASPGDTITIKGRNFDRFHEPSGINKVTIGGVEAIFTGDSSATEIQIEIPEEAETGEIVVCVLNPNESRSNQLCTDSDGIELGCGNSVLEIVKPFVLDTTDILNFSSIYLSFQLQNENFILLNRYNGKVTELSKDLTVINQFYALDEIDKMDILDAIALSEGGFIILSDNHEKQRSTISKFDSNSSTPLWPRSLPYNFNADEYHNGGLIQIENGNLLVFENFSEFIGYSKQVFTIFDSKNGERIFGSKIIENITSCSGNDILKVFESNDYFHLVGTSTAVGGCLGAYLSFIDRNDLTVKDTELIRNSFIRTHSILFNNLFLTISGYPQISISEYDFFGGFLNRAPISLQTVQNFKGAVDDSCYLLSDGTSIISSEPFRLKKLMDSYLLDIIPTKNNQFLFLTISKSENSDLPDFTDLRVQTFYTDCNLEEIN